MKNYIPRLLNIYNTDVKFALQKKLKIKNIMQIPKLDKIVLNMGIGDARDNKTSLKQAIEEITLITGQKPVVTKAKNAISNFKIRIGDPVGVKVTLRKNYMYEFFDRFISVTSPRIRDFRGFSFKGFDGRGNYNFGITEQIIFSEIDYDKINSIRGMNVSIITSSEDDSQAYTLLQSFGFPINEPKKIIKEEAKKNNLSNKNLTKEILDEELKIDSNNLEKSEKEDVEREKDEDTLTLDSSENINLKENNTDNVKVKKTQKDENSLDENNVLDSNQNVKGK